MWIARSIYNFLRSPSITYQQRRQHWQQTNTSDDGDNGEGEEEEQSWHDSSDINNNNASSVGSMEIDYDLSRLDVSSSSLKPLFEDSTTSHQEQALDNSHLSKVREYSVYLPGSPERLRVKGPELNNFLSSPRGKTKGLRFKMCNDEQEERLFYTEQDRQYEQLLERDIDGQMLVNTDTLSPLSGTNPSSFISSPVIAEPELPYKSPPSQQLTEFRLAIERHQHSVFDQLLKENPRFLVNTSNDLPTLLHIGARYNTLHIACRSSNVHVVRETLRLLADLDWLAMAYATDVCMEERSRNLLDAIISTPDKISLNTALHFACKHGPPEIVAALLVNNPNRTAVNNYDEKAFDVIGQAFKGTTAEKRIARNKIICLFHRDWLQYPNNKNTPYNGKNI